MSTLKKYKIDCCLSVRYLALRIYQGNSFPTVRFGEVISV